MPLGGLLLDLDINLGQATYINSLSPASAQLGLPSTPTVANINSAEPTLSGSFNANSSYTASLSDYGGNSWNAVLGYDFGNDGEVDESLNNSVLAGDEERAYISEFSINISQSDGNAFSPNASFAFSFDGMQYRDTLAIAEAVPEPSFTALLSIVGIAFFFRRKR